MAGMTRAFKVLGEENVTRSEHACFIGRGDLDRAREPDHELSPRLGLFGMAALGRSTSKEHCARRDWLGDTQLVRCRLVGGKRNLDVLGLRRAVLTGEEAGITQHHHSMPGSGLSPLPPKAAWSGSSPTVCQTSSTREIISGCRA